MSIGSEGTAIDAGGGRGEKTDVRFESEDDGVRTCITGGGGGGGGGGITSC